MEKLTVEGTSILVWRDAITPAECEAMIARFDWLRRQYLLDDRAAASEIGALFTSRMHGAPQLEWERHLTISAGSRPLDWHVDVEVAGSRATHKALLYLSDVPDGGTVFSRKEQVLVAASRGAIALFDIGIEHRSQHFAPEHRKYTLGLRGVASLGS